MTEKYRMTIVKTPNWIPNPGVPCSKPLDCSKINSAFHLSVFLAVKSKLPPRNGSLAVRQLNPIHKKGAIKFFLIKYYVNIFA